MLYQGGHEIALTPKQVETLFALIEGGGEIVNKDTLMNRLWGNAFVEESNLNQNIYVLRKILGKTVDGRPMIETFRRRGYRFNGKLKQNERTRPENAPGKQPEEAAHLLHFPLDISSRRNAQEPAVGNSHRKKQLITLFAFLTVLATSISGYLYSRMATSDSSKRTIAVLPLRPISLANRDEIYEIGIADSLIHRLNTEKSLIVRPLSATRKYTGLEQDPVAAGREQRADYVLALSYQLSDGKVRVIAQLLNTATGQLEDSYKIEKEAGDVFVLQDAIAGEIGNLLLSRFGYASTSVTAKRGTTNEEAYGLYLQGIYFSDNRHPEGLRKAIDALEHAVRIDPNYAEAWAGKAIAHRAISNFGRHTDLQEEYRKSIEATNKALALDPNMSEAYSALCENRFIFEWDFAGAELLCRRAIELDPESSLARQIYSRFLMGRGRSAEAITEIKAAIELEPASLYNQRLYGNCLLNARRFEEAATQFERVLTMNEDFGTSYMWLTTTLALMGKEAEAFEVLMKSLTRQNASQETVRAFRKAYATSGWQGILRYRADTFEQGNETYFQGAAYNAELGNKDKAFEYLDKSVGRREWGIHILEVDPRFDSLRGDTRYGLLLARVGTGVTRSN
ncbi:MAG TPA: winged helix-turn-helix domain-containing protein [Pyrinomonadaceae bacterium]|nr:winged helix-turn-helix domain-containing protein [Pyrinomonadaceae bacterium]